MRSLSAVLGQLVPLLLALLTMLPQSALALTASQVYEQVKDSIVVVKAYDQKGKQVGLGSGVMLPSGDIITNFHVVKAGVRYTVGRGKQSTPATLKSGDPDQDLCLLTAPALVAEPARLGKAARLKVGDPVYAVGAPQGLELSLSEGIVSQLRGGGPHPIIQTTVAISGGSSGGGLFNAEGELVGITTFYLKEGQSLNFALPVEWIAQIKRPEVIEVEYDTFNKIVGKKAEPKRYRFFDKPPEIVADKAPMAPEPGAKPKEGWENRAVALGKARNWPGLLAHCRRWTQAEPGNAFAWTNLGVAYGKMGRHREEIEAYREALRLKPDYADAWVNLGTTYGDMGRYREAVGAFQEALRLKPDFAEAWENLALTYVVLGNRSAALEAVKELRRYDTQAAEKLFNLIMKP